MHSFLNVCMRMFFLFSNLVKIQGEEVEDGSYHSTIMAPMVSNVVKKNEISSNPFEDSDDDEDEGTGASKSEPVRNPFEDSDDDEEEDEGTNASKSESARNPFEDSDDDDEELDDITASKSESATNPFLTSSEDEGEDNFDESNPFAEDARAERKSIRGNKSSPFQRASADRLSQKDRAKLKKIGVDESNPFAEDLLEEPDEEIKVPRVSSKIQTSPGHKKLVLKTKHGHKVKAPPPPPTSTPQNANQPTGQPKPKKRNAPKAPARPISAPVIDTQSSLRRSFKKRAAPKPPTQTTPNKVESSADIENYTPPKPIRREPGQNIPPPNGIAYANVEFQSGQLKINPESYKEDTNVAKDSELETQRKDDGQAVEVSEVTGKLSDNEENLEETNLEHDESESLTKNIDSAAVVEEIQTGDGEDEIENRSVEVEGEEEDEEIDAVSELNGDVSSQPTRQLSEKRKAPTRPPPPHRMESLDENEVSHNVFFSF